MTSHEPRLAYPDNARFFEDSTASWRAPYVQRLMDEGMPLWMVDYERSSGRTEGDTLGNDSARATWNFVRKSHGFEPLTSEELLQRHAEDAGWTMEYAEWNREQMNYYSVHLFFSHDVFEGQQYADGRPND